MRTKNTQEALDTTVLKSDFQIAFPDEMRVKPTFIVPVSEKLDAYVFQVLLRYGHAGEIKTREGYAVRLRRKDGTPTVKTSIFEGYRSEFEHLFDVENELYRVSHLLKPKVRTIKSKVVVEEDGGDY